MVTAPELGSVIHRQSVTWRIHRQPQDELPVIVGLRIDVGALWPVDVA